MRVLDIVEATTVDGPGFRTSVYLAGCDHHCPGCHNPQSWDHEGGVEMDAEQLLERLFEIGLDVTFSGGDPMLQAGDIITVASGLKKKGYSVWVYTGYLYEYAETDPIMSRLLDHIDVLVDGPYVASRRDTGLQFKGSSNQRLVDVQASRRSGEVIIWHSTF
ncbi:MAG: anaerobic ribonucleoside-triphosphate reductase activating protein [Paramuribaculum sp.]|nr:anaerobic ribonucleoside-triphosphate reductase activating protein [Bacteroides sp.]MDE6826490.1 anaerobic ribonucleoside-triphosphate reductase activating protein [Paramuribaculum sp.]